MNADLKKRSIIFFVVLIVALLFLGPTLYRDVFGSGWISKPISLGLDLRGGIYLKYQVKTKEAVKSRLQATANAIRADLRKAKIAVTRARVNEKNQVEITLLSNRSIDEAKSAIENNYRELTFIDRVVEEGRVRLLYGVGELAAKKIEENAVIQAVETLRNRVDQFGVSEPLINNVGQDRILLQIPGRSDIESVKKIVGSVAKLEFRLVPVPGSTTHQVNLKDREGGSVAVEEEALMMGDAVESASFSIIDGQVEVFLNLTSEGAKDFRRITSENVGRELAIVLDGVVYSHPRISEAIGGGRARITGRFSVEEARQLAVVLRAGALPAPLEPLEERTVGPTLGKESIQKGITAIVMGLLFVLIFMVSYYKKSGVVAVASLVLNMILLLAGLSAFGATLTLPGLAGLALTIGMAVDSNVIIFERIRDELRTGAHRDAAVKTGFEKALSAIIDSNLTTLFSAIILYYFGTGPIRGFAVTLSLGIATTVYCAIFASQLAFDYFKLESRKGLSI